MRQHHAAVTCHSSENADRFYTGILGLEKLKTSLLSKELAEILFDIPMECQIILYGNDDVTIEVFITNTRAFDSDPFVHLCLEVEDKTDFANRCDEAGLIVKRVSRGDATLIFVKDFDGNLYEIKEIA